MNKCLKFFAAISIALALAQTASGQQIQEIRISKGQSADLWFGANVTGKVHLSIRTRDGRNKLNMWWITWGVGSTSQVGDWGPSGDLEIPITWWKGTVSAKLRGKASDDTIVYLSDKVTIDKAVTFKW